MVDSVVVTLCQINVYSGRELTILETIRELNKLDVLCTFVCAFTSDSTPPADVHISSFLEEFNTPTF